MSELVLISGCPASGKTQHTTTYAKKGFYRLNRDTEGGSIADLVPMLDNFLKTRSSVVLDNLFPTVASRKPFIEVAKKHGVPIKCVQMDTSLEDSQINALHRMHKNHKRFFLTPESVKGINDPSVFPIAVFFKYRKEFEKPTLAEGFLEITSVPFKRVYDPAYKNKALILDYDDTLRGVIDGGKYKFPIVPNEVGILPNRKKTLLKYAADGYVMCGVSNQSGIARGQAAEENVRDCFDYTNKQLGTLIDYQYCPHSVPPSCYCRKPQSGLGVLLIEKHKLDPSKCIFVGDQTTDETFAKRLGFQYVPSDKFFK